MDLEYITTKDIGKLRIRAFHERHYAIFPVVELERKLALLTLTIFRSEEVNKR